MKIIIPTHNHEQIKVPIDKDLIYHIDTEDLNNEFNNEFYAEIAKQLYVYKHKLINDDIIGFYQNRRYLDIDLQNIQLNENEVILCEPVIWYHVLKSNSTLYENVSLLQQMNLGHLFIKNNNTIIENILGDDMNYFNTIKLFHFHNIFIGTNKFFYNYSEYLFNILSSIKNKFDNMNLITNEKIGAWLAERLLNIYVIKYNIKIFYTKMIELPK